jgi:cyanophycinase
MTSSTSTAAPTVLLHGGGRTPSPLLWRAFALPRVAIVVLEDDEPEPAFARWDGVLAAAGAGARIAVPVSAGRPLEPGHLVGCDGVVIAHGLTPGYAAAVTPHAATLREVLSTLVVGGSSAGAAVLAEHALVGGWRLSGRAVCAEEAGEDLEEVRVVPGLGLLPGACVDVHAAQWGTLSRLVATVAAGLAPAGVALDEETVLTNSFGGWQVRGAGHAWELAGPDAPPRVLRDGDALAW